MIIPNKYSGYQAGIRLYPSGGGGGGGSPAPAPAAAAPPPPPSNPWDKLGVNTQTGYNTLMAQKGKPYEQSGGAYNSLLSQGFNDDQIRSSMTSLYGAPSNESYNAMVQNAGMTSATGRPVAGSAQFYQPVYQSQYQNYARPATQFDTSMYGTQPVYSPARAWNDANSGSAAGGQQVVNNAISNYFQQNPNSDINSTLAAMRGVGINRTDIQSWGGVNNYGPSVQQPQQPQMNWQTGQMTQPAQQAPFNPYTNSFGGGFGGFGGGFDSGYGGFMPQMQSPYSYQQPMQQAQPAQQSPLSSIGRAIVGRSSQARGTPNVMRRAEGGIASLMDDE